MSARRTVARMAALGAVPVALSMAAAAPAAANGPMTDLVSRVPACFAEGPEPPRFAACMSAAGAQGSPGAHRVQAAQDVQGVQAVQAVQAVHRDQSAPRVHSSPGAPETKSGGRTDRLAQTVGDGTTTNLAVAGASVLVVGAALVCFGARRRDLGRCSGNREA